MFLQQNPDEFAADWDEQRSTIIIVFSKGRRPEKRFFTMIALDH